MTWFRKIFVGTEVQCDSAVMTAMWQGAVADACLHDLHDQQAVSW